MHEDSFVNFDGLPQVPVMRDDSRDDSYAFEGFPSR